MTAKWLSKSSEVSFSLNVKTNEAFVARRRFTFVLRLWLETEVSNATTGGILRGSLELVEPKQLYYFNSLDQIPALLRATTGWQDQSGPSGQAGEEATM